MSEIQYLNGKFSDFRGVCTETIGHAVRRHLAPDSAFLVSPLQVEALWARAWNYA